MTVTRRFLGVSFVLVLTAVTGFEALRPDRVLIYRDHLFVFQHVLRMVSAAYAEGHSALWDPWTGGGEPLAAYPSALAYSPLALFLTMPASFDVLYDVFVLLHLPLAAYGMRSLASELGAREESAWLAGLAYAFSGVVVSLNSLLPAFASASFGPFALAAGLRVTRGPTPRRLAAFAVALALHVMTTDPLFLVSTVIVFFVGWSTLRAEPEAVSWARALGALSVGAALAFFLAGIQIFPLIDLLARSERGAGFSYALQTSFSLEPIVLLNLFIPGFTGDLSALQTLFCGEGEHYLHSIYLGASVLPLIFLGGSLPGRRRWVVTFFVLLGLALGGHTPLFRLIADIPGLAASKFPIKLMYGVALVHAILLASAGDALLTGEPSLRRIGRWVVLPLSVGAAVVSLYLVFGDLAGLESQAGLALSVVDRYLRPAGLRALILLGFGGLTLHATTSSRLSAPRAVLVFFVLISADLGLAARPLLLTAEVHALDRPPAAERLLQDRADPVLDVVDPRKYPTRMPAANYSAIVASGAARLTPGVGQRFGIRYVFDSDLNYTRSERWTAVAALLDGLPFPERARVLAREGVTHVLMDALDGNVPGLEPLAQVPVSFSEDTWLFRVPQARAHVFLAEHVEIVPDWNDLLSALTASTTGDRIALIESDLPPNSIARGTSAFTRGRVHDVVSRPGRIAFELEAEAASFAVVSEQWTPDWIGSVDGRPVEVVPAEGLLLGIPVPAGAKHVVVEYAPPSFGLGLASTAVGLLIVAALSGRGHRPRRRT